MKKINSETLQIFPSDLTWNHPAMEKSTVNKLEKAEILQMTVNHQKTIQNNPSWIHCALFSHLHAFSTATFWPQPWLGHPYSHYEDPQYVLPVPPTISMDKNGRDKSYQQPQPARPCYSEGLHYSRALPHYRPWGGEIKGLYWVVFLLCFMILNKYS